VDGVAAATLPTDDRGLAYGDGLFETIALNDGRPRLWARHMERLRRGAERLHMECPDTALLWKDLEQLPVTAGRSVLKILVTRGSGGRGYRPPESAAVRRILSLSPWPDYPAEWWRQGVTVRICDTPLSENPRLAGIKHLNRLPQVLASAEWRDPRVAEGLMCAADGQIVCGTRTNLFMVRSGRLRTPPLDRCGVAGVMRAELISLSRELGIPLEERPLSRESLAAADELFLTNSLIGIWPVRELAARTLGVGPLTRQLATALQARLEHEHG